MKSFNQFFKESAPEKQRYSITNLFVRGSRVGGVVIATSAKAAITRLVARHLTPDMQGSVGVHIQRAHAVGGYKVEHLGVLNPPVVAHKNTNWWEESTSTIIMHVPKSGKELPDFVNTAFNDLANEQRGDPEHAMFEATMFHSGVLAFCLEHVGDLTHRMAQEPKFFDGGYEYVEEKVRKCLRYLTQSYGFRREVELNMKNNHSVNNRNMAFETYENTVKNMCGIYTAEHRKLTVYNSAQWLARQAAIDLGLWKFNYCIACLSSIKEMYITPDAWSSHALTYFLDSDGRLVPYTPGLEKQAVPAKI